MDGEMHPYDLIEVKEQLHLWCNVLRREPFVGEFYSDKSCAKTMNGPRHEPEIIEFVEVVK